jgi:hypothetical protein
VGGRQAYAATIFPSLSPSGHSRIALDIAGIATDRQGDDRSIGEFFGKQQADPLETDSRRSKGRIRVHFFFRWGYTPIVKFQISSVFQFN